MHRANGVTWVLRRPSTQVTRTDTREVPRPPVKWPMREKEVTAVEFDLRCRM
jgi:hypothetical protein